MSKIPKTKAEKSKILAFEPLVQIIVDFFFLHGLPQTDLVFCS